MSRQDQYDVTVSITKGTENKDTGTWDKMDGGEIDSEELKYRPGAMGPEESLGGFVSVGNITVSRLFKIDRDGNDLGWLIACVGKATATITKQPLDVDGHKTGKPLIYSGRVKAVTPPEVDSESSDAALIEMEISSAGIVTIAAAAA